MPTPSAQRLSQTEYLTDGVTTVWNFSFSGGYILSSHVKAYTEDIATGLRTEIVVTAPMLIGPFQIQITPVLAVGSKLVIYRDTPKDLPLVDFTDESGFSEVSLDTNAKQAVFVAAETQDAVGTFSTTAASVAAAAAIAAADSATAAAVAANASASAAAASAGAISLPLVVASGGTGSTTAATARNALGAAASGANTDITSLGNLTAGALPAASVLTSNIADANVVPAKLSQPLTLRTAIAASGLSSLAFTSIPSWAKKITVVMAGLSTGGATNYQLQVGSGSFAVSGYSSAYSNIDGTNTTTTGSSTTSFVAKTSVNAANTYSGMATLVLVSGNTWVCTSQVNSNSGVSTTQSGTITLAGALDRVQLTADTFDAGSINILYEG